MAFLVGVVVGIVLIGALGRLSETVRDLFTEFWDE